LIKINSLRTEYEGSDASDRAEALRAAAADYIAAQVENTLDISWWETSESFPLSDAADVLNSSAEWLRSLAERPLAAAAQAVGVGGPVVPIWAGITAQLATARLTAPLENAARICEIVGVLVGVATGMHPLVVACANRLAHDELVNALAGVFERALDPESTNDEPGTQKEIQPTDDTNPINWLREPQQDAALDRNPHATNPIGGLEELRRTREEDALYPQDPVDGHDATDPLG